MESYSKLDALKLKRKCELKSYITEMSMKEARTQFKIRTRMFPCKMNYQGDLSNVKDIWRCNDCRNIDTQAHILWCPAYKKLRKGKSLDNDDDLIEYFQKVFTIRMKND